MQRKTHHHAVCRYLVLSTTSGASVSGTASQKMMWNRCCWPSRLYPWNVGQQPGNHQGWLNRLNIVISHNSAPTNDGISTNAIGKACSSVSGAGGWWSMARSFHTFRNMPFSQQL